MGKGSYETVLGLCKVVIERDYAPCGLEEDVKKRLQELTLEWERRKKKADKEGRAIGGLDIFFKDVYRAVRQAESNAKRYGKSKCYYLERGLRIPLDKPGGLGYWSLRMRE